MSNLAFHVFERLNAAFDPTKMREEEARRVPFAAQVVSFLETGEFIRQPKPLSREEIERRERAFFNPPASRRESRDVDWYRIALEGGVPRLLKHYMGSFGASFDQPLSGTNEHLLHYTMNVGQEFATEAHRTPASFQKGLAECARIIARQSRDVLKPQRHGPTLATDAFNFIGLSEKAKHANAGARAEVVLATLYNQLFRKVGKGRDAQVEPLLPLFRPPESQPSEAAREAHYQVHNLVAIQLNHPDSYAGEIIRGAQKLDPQGLAFWMRVPPPPPLRPA